LIVIEAAAVAVAPKLSFTWTVKLDVPTAVGTPAITPVEAEILKPAGKVPVTTLHEYGVTPPEATSDVL